jgi:hypothetical protein
VCIAMGRWVSPNTSSLPLNHLLITRVDASPLAGGSPRLPPHYLLIASSLPPHYPSRCTATGRWVSPITSSLPPHYILTDLLTAASPPLHLPPPSSHPRLITSSQFKRAILAGGSPQLTPHYRLITSSQFKRAIRNLTVESVAIRNEKGGHSVAA